MKIKKTAKRDLHKLDRKVRERVFEVFAKGNFCGLPLHGPLAGFYKLRIGDWRVIYKLDGTEIIVYSIGHRSKVYKNKV